MQPYVLQLTSSASSVGADVFIYSQLTLYYAWRLWTEAALFFHLGFSWGSCKVSQSLSYFKWRCVCCEIGCSQRVNNGKLKRQYLSLLFPICLNCLKNNPPENMLFLTKLYFFCCKKIKIEFLGHIFFVSQSHHKLFHVLTSFVVPLGLLMAHL